MESKEEKDKRRKAYFDSIKETREEFQWQLEQDLEDMIHRDDPDADPELFELAMGPCPPPKKQCTGDGKSTDDPDPDDEQGGDDLSPETKQCNRDGKNTDDAMAEIEAESDYESDDFCEAEDVVDKQCGATDHDPEDPAMLCKYISKYREIHGKRTGAQKEEKRALRRARPWEVLMQVAMRLEGDCPAAIQRTFERSKLSAADKVILAKHMLNMPRLNSPSLAGVKTLFQKIVDGVALAPAPASKVPSVVDALTPAGRL